VSVNRSILLHSLWKATPRHNIVDTIKLWIPIFLSRIQYEQIQSIVFKHFGCLLSFMQWTIINSGFCGVLHNPHLFLIVWFKIIYYVFLQYSLLGLLYHWCMFCVLYLASYHFFCACVVECLLHDCLSRKKHPFFLEY
jgi:hypothetical protein